MRCNKSNLSLHTVHTSRIQDKKMENKACLAVRQPKGLPGDAINASELGANMDCSDFSDAWTVFVETRPVARPLAARFGTNRKAANCSVISSQFFNRYLDTDLFALTLRFCSHSVIPNIVVRLQRFRDKLSQKSSEHNCPSCTIQKQDHG